VFEHILVPLDGSELAEVALRHAEALASKLASDVVLLHVLEDSDAEYRRMHESYLENAARSVQGGNAVSVSTVLVEGHVAEQIIDYADEASISMIVMATRGRSGVRRWVMGSVADKVVRAASQPVALIRATGEEVSKPAFGRILLPLDGSGEAESVLPYAEELALRLSSEIILVSVVPPVSAVYAFPGETVQFPYTEADVHLMKGNAEAYLENVKARLEAKGLRPSLKVLVGNTAEEVITAAERAHADLVAMSTHGRSGVSRWAFGSVTDKVLREGTTPILLVRTGQEGS